MICRREKLRVMCRMECGWVDQYGRWHSYSKEKRARRLTMLAISVLLVLGATVWWAMLHKREALR